VFEARIDSVIAQENPAIASYNPDNDAEFQKLVAQPGREEIRAFLESRERLAQRLQQLSPPEWHRPGRHPDFPYYDVHFQVEYMAHHEAHHIYQMFQRRVPFGKMPH